MARKARITREMITEAAISIIRETGLENVSARSVADRLKCSTQPVLYWFDSVDEIKKSAYTRASQYHTEYLLQKQLDETDSLLAVGLNYIQFASDEPNLFRFLLQSNYLPEGDLSELMKAEDLSPIFEVMQKEMKLSRRETEEVFMTLALCVHGYASLIVNNTLKYDEKAVSEHLRRVYRGAVLALKGDEK